MKKDENMAETEEGKIKRVINWFRRYGLFVALVILTAIFGAAIPLTISTATATPVDRTMLIIYLAAMGISLILLCIVITKVHKNQQTIDDKQKELDNCREGVVEVSKELEYLQSVHQETVEAREEDLVGCMEECLSVIFSSKFNLHERERVTLYIHNSENNHFKKVSRVSGNMVYKNPGSRDTIPDSEGCLGVAWQYGDCNEKLVEDENELDEHSFVDLQIERFGILKDVAENFTMQTLHYLGKRIGAKTKGAGVLLFEADNLKTLNHHKMRTIDDYIEGILPLFVEKYNRIMAEEEAVKKSASVGVAKGDEY